MALILPDQTLKTHKSDKFRQMTLNLGFYGDDPVFWVHCRFLLICGHRASGKGREVTKWTPWNERNGKWQWTGWKRWNDGKKVTKGRGEFKTKGTRYRKQERRVETKGKEVTRGQEEVCEADVRLETKGKKYNEMSGSKRKEEVNEPDVRVEKRRR